MEGLFVRTHRGRQVIVLDETALTVFFVAHSMMTASDPGLHRTEVSLMGGDALDAVELEMANDNVTQKAEAVVASASENLGNLVGAHFHAQKDLVIPWTDRETVNAMLQWSNRIYTYLRQADTENFIIGMPQDEDESLTLDFDGSPQEFLILYASALTNEIATALWEE